MSPLGRYAEGVAAIVSLALVATFLVIIILGNEPPDDLKDMVLLALGYVFVKGGVQAGEKRAEATAATAGDAQATAAGPVKPHTHDAKNDTPAP